MTWIDDFLQSDDELSRRRIVRRGMHATHFELGAGVRRAVVTGAPQYFRSQGGWQAYDLSLRQAGASWGAPGVPVRLSADGTLAFANGYRQRTRSVGVLAGEAYRPLAALPAAGSVLGARLRREAGIFRHELALVEAGVKEELHVLEPPRNLAGEYLVYETLSEGPVQGLHFPRGTAVDAAGQVFALHEFRQEGVSYTGLALEELQRAEFPLVFDPSVEAEGLSADGYIRGEASSYATARATSSLFSSTGNDLYVGQGFESGVPRYYVYRAFAKFSLASLDPAVQIYAATLYLSCLTDSSTLAEFDVQIVRQNWSAQDPLSDANREAAHDGCLGGMLETVWQNTSGLPTSTRLPSPPLTPGYLTPGADVYYSLRSSRDAANTTPPGNGSEYIRIGSATHANTERRPLLVVDYFVAPAAAGRLGLPLPRVGIYDTRIKLRARKRRALLAAGR